MGLSEVSSNFIIKFWNVSTGVFILRVGREKLPKAEISLLMMTKLQEKPCRVRILHVGGTLEKVENDYKRRSEAWLESTSKKLEMKYKD
mmetsp:Transcript_30319/g.41087  ORF Transcript_30319/g.41087 Transcript_30319/m.41087 type:complete len:89 (+) Transcript_30319:136-402(+)